MADNDEKIPVAMSAAMATEAVLFAKRFILFSFSLGGLQTWGEHYSPTCRFWFQFCMYLYLIVSIRFRLRPPGNLARHATKYECMEWQQY